MSNLLICLCLFSVILSPMAVYLRMPMYNVSPHSYKKGFPKTARYVFAPRKRVVYPMKAALRIARLSKAIRALRESIIPTWDTISYLANTVRVKQSFWIPLFVENLIRQRFTSKCSLLLKHDNADNRATSVCCFSLPQPKFSIKNLVSMSQPSNAEDIELNALSSCQTSNQTVSFQSEPRYSSYWSDPISYESGESVFVGEAVRATILPQNLPLPVTPVVPPLSLFPLNRTGFLLQLPQQDIDRLLQPVKQGILSVDTVFSIKDVNTDISMAVSAIDMMEILEANGRTVSLLNEEPVYDEIKPPKSKKRFIILASTVILVIAGVIALTLSLTLGGKPPLSEGMSYGAMENSSDAVFLIFGGIDRVLMDDGYEDIATNTVELYYPHNRSLNQLLNETTIIPRTAGVAVILNEVIILAGGSNDSRFEYSIPECEIYNLTDSTFRLGPSLNQPRVFAAGAVYESVFYLCGGYDRTKTDHEPQFASCEKLTSTLAKWELIASMYIGRIRPIMGIFNDMLYVAGGDTLEPVEAYLPVETYDVSSNTWNNGTERISQCAIDVNSGFDGSSRAINFYTPNHTRAILYDTETQCTPCLLEEGKREWKCFSKLNGWYLPAFGWSRPYSVKDSVPSELYAFPAMDIETKVVGSRWRENQTLSEYGLEWDYGVTHMKQQRKCPNVVSL